MPSRARPIIVVKFGGTALESPARVVTRLRSLSRGASVVVVVSARAGVTDALVHAVARGQGAGATPRLLRGLLHRHPGLTDRGHARLEELAGFLGRGRPPFGGNRGRILATGERLAADWLASRLNRAGLRAVALDADDAGLTARPVRGGGARIDIAASRSQLRQEVTAVLRLRAIPVLTGFFGMTRAGRILTFGRGSSDYTATALAAVLSAERVDLVKGRPGIRSADPARVPAARLLPRLSYATAERAARGGARVLHPRALEPVRARRIPVRITGLTSRALGTVIGPGAPRPEPSILLLADARSERRPAAVRAAYATIRILSLDARTLRSRVASVLGVPVEKVRAGRGALSVQVPRTDVQRSLARLDRGLSRLPK